MRRMLSDPGWEPWVMFVGSAEERDDSPVPHSSITTVAVERVYRGRMPARVTGRDTGDGGSCGMNLPSGRWFLIAREGDDGVYEATYCGSFPMTDALEAELDKASAGYATTDEASDAKAMRYLPIAFGLGATALLIAAIAFILRQRTTGNG